MPPGTHGPAGQSERGFFLFDWQVISARKRGVVIPAGKPESSAMEGTLDGIKVYLEHENVVIFLWMKPFWLQTRGLGVWKTRCKQEGDKAAGPLEPPHDRRPLPSAFYNAR